MKAFSLERGSQFQMELKYFGQNLNQCTKFGRKKLVNPNKKLEKLSEKLLFYHD